MALSKPRPILQDMPPHIKEKIFNKLDCFLYKMSLQKAFPEFRRVLRNPEFPFREFELTCLDEENGTRIEACGDFEEFVMKYIPSKNGTTLFCTHEDGPGYERFIPETLGNHIDLLVETFECLVKNPKFELNCLSIDCFLQSAETEQATRHRQEFMDKLGNMLKNLKRQIKVSQLDIDCFGKQDNVLKILPYIDPDHLKRLLLYRNDNLIDGIDTLVELEHWKKIDHLSMFDLPDNKFPIEYWWNFPITVMELKYTSLKDIRRLVQHFRRSETFVSCLLETNFRQEQLKDALGKTRVLVSHPNSYYESYMEFPATKTLKRIFVCFPGHGGGVDIATQLENSSSSEDSSDEDY